MSVLTDDSKRMKRKLIKIKWDEREQQIRSDLGPDDTDEQVADEMRRREVTAYELSQVETYDVTEGDDEMEGSN